MTKFPIPSKKDLERFFSKVLKSSNENGCWWWDGYKDKQGYGSFKFNNKMVLAHRFLHLQKVSDNIFCCHKCDNPECVNPDHIFYGTNADNINDMYKKGRGRTYSDKGESRYNSKLTNEDVIFIKKYTYKHGDKIKLAKKYNVAPSVIHNILSGRKWKHITI